jgi:hypothetical protein
MNRMDEKPNREPSLLQILSEFAKAIATFGPVFDVLAVGVLALLVLLLFWLRGC